MNRVCSVSQQILNVFWRAEFEQLARRHGAIEIRFGTDGQFKSWHGVLP